MPFVLPSSVAPNELIQSVWGNSVVNALDWLNDEDNRAATDTVGATGITGTNNTRVFRHPISDSQYMVTINGFFVNAKGSDLAVGNQVLTVPSGYRPVAVARVVGINANFGHSGSFNVQTTGAVDVQAFTTMPADAHTVIISGTWLSSG